MARSRKLESGFQDYLRDRIIEMFPGCRVSKIEFHQGCPDLLILWGVHWAMLETKRWSSAAKQPNQDYWVEYYDRWSFCRFVNPQNIEEVLDDLQQAFRD